MLLALWNAAALLTIVLLQQLHPHDRISPAASIAPGISVILILPPFLVSTDSSAGKPDLESSIGRHILTLLSNASSIESSSPTIDLPLSPSASSLMLTELGRVGRLLKSSYGQPPSKLERAIADVGYS